MKTRKIVLMSILICCGASLKMTAQDWSLTGNSGTSVPANFIGTTDDVDVFFKRNKIFAGRIGLSNTTFGVNSLPVVTTGTWNTSFGVNNLTANTIGYSNYVFGNNSMMSNISGQSNVAIGSGVLAGNINGHFNIVVGGDGMVSNLSGTGNNAFGQSSLNKNTTGNQNAAFGHLSLIQNESGSNNCAFGPWALSHSKGSGNIAIGSHAGESLTTGDNNIYIGIDAFPYLTNSGSNQLNIGKVITGVNMYNYDSSKIGIGLPLGSIPGNRLEIYHGTKGNSGLRLTTLPNTVDGITNPTNKVLSVNQFGDVILVNSISGGTGSSCNLYTCDGTISSGSALRTVHMAKNNLFFETLSATDYPDSGKIYIGERTNFAHDTGDYRLYVEGGILTEKIKVALRNPDADWKDGVFASDYKLMPLKDVEAFVAANKHLPEIDSAKDLVECGLDLGEMQSKQMGKIEELTLYAIEQEKKLNAQDTELKAQGKEISELKAYVKALLEKNK
jgi:hypothetical protein